MYYRKLLLTKTRVYRHASFEGPDLPQPNAEGKIELTKEQFELHVKTAAEEASATAKKQAQEAVSRLELLTKDQKLTKEQKESLSKEIETLRAQYTTVEEQKKITVEKMQKDHQAALEAETKAKQEWQDRYSKYRKENDLHRAASAENAFSPEQITKLLFHYTHITEQKEGDKIIDYVPMVKLVEGGKELLLTPLDAVKHLKGKVETFGNLFKADGKSGTGLLNSQKQETAGELTAAQIAALPPEEYEKWRKRDLYKGRHGQIVVMSSGSGNN